mgnify:CR=1 FL=1
MAESLVRSASKNSKVFDSKLSKESLKQSLLEGGVGKRTKYKEFMEMKFRLEGDSVSGQTILRNFGSGRRSSGNFRTLCRKLNIGLNYFARKRADFSDPETIKRILEDSNVRLSSIRFTKFKSIRLNSDLFEGKGEKLLIRYESAKALKAGHSSKAERILNRGYSTKKEFVRFIEGIGATNRYYSSFLQNRKLLRKLLLSSEFDFEAQPVFLTEFLKMRFKCSALIRRGRDTITGQGLLLKCFGHKNTFRLENIQTMLGAAGFDTGKFALSRKRFRSRRIDLEDPATAGLLRGVLASCKEKVDWAKIKFGEFKFVRFSSPGFKGIGYTLLNRVGGATSTNMRRIIALAGYNNPVPAKWQKRLKDLEERKASEQKKKI